MVSICSSVNVSLGWLPSLGQKWSQNLSWKKLLFPKAVLRSSTAVLRSSPATPRSPLPWQMDRRSTRMVHQSLLSITAFSTPPLLLSFPSRPPLCWTVCFLEVLVAMRIYQMMLYIVVHLHLPTGNTHKKELVKLSSLWMVPTHQHNQTKWILKW